MIAVVEIGGKQYVVEKDSTILVDRQQAEVGKKVEFQALLTASEDGKTVNVGAPLVEGSKVVFKVEEHTKADKVTVFKIKSKKRYMRTRGFRAQQTRLSVVSIA